MTDEHKLIKAAKQAVIMADDFDAVREIVKQLHTGSGDQMQTFTKITHRIFAELGQRGWSKEPTP